MSNQKIKNEWIAEAQALRHEMREQKKADEIKRLQAELANAQRSASRTKRALEAEVKRLRDAALALDDRLRELEAENAQLKAQLD